MVLVLCLQQNALLDSLMKCVLNRSLSDLCEIGQGCWEVGSASLQQPVADNCLCHRQDPACRFHFLQLCSINQDSRLFTFSSGDPSMKSGNGIPARCVYLEEMAADLDDQDWLDMENIEQV